MKKITILLLLAVPFLLQAQEKGMRFEKGLSWAEIKAKAKKENKPILMDCFTTWCGPCKYMDANVFPTEEAGAYFNEKFILARVQLDTTAKDNDEVKKWYADGHNIAAEYKVRAYPTYLFFNPDGELVHRVVGSVAAPKDFIARASAALDPDKQYYALLRKYEGGERSVAFLRKFSEAAANAFEQDKAFEAADAYLATVTDPYTKENLSYVLKFASKESGKAFGIIVANPAKVDEILGRKISDQMIMNTVMNDKMSKLLAKNAPPADWPALEQELKQKYTAYADELTGKLKVYYFQNKKDWNNFQSAVVDYMTKYGAKSQSAELNSFAWTVFENCKDMTCVTQALDWSKRSFESNNNPLFMDTYANILYKMGKKEDALAWEEKAIALADDATKKELQDTLDKMKKGEKTWKND
ncbi:MAG: hypothetical protein JWN76_3231 [Chitinophagaceae bacterium]|nr:hypothetical protein [Chitinophagaceae bacterium]